MADQRLSAEIVSRFDAKGVQAARREFAQLASGGDAVSKKLTQNGTSFTAFAANLKKGNATLADFNDLLLDAAKNSGMSASQLSRMVGATGQYTDRQQLAAHATKQVAEKARELTAAVQAGTMTTREAGRAFAEFAAGQQVTGKSIGEVVFSLKNMAIAAAAAGVAMRGAMALFNLGKSGAEIELLNGKFDRLAASIGTTGDALRVDLREATRGMTSETEAVSGATDLMALGLAKTHDEAVRLTRVSSALGMGLNELVLTLSNKTTMRFDALGVSVEGFTAKVAALEAAGLSADEAFKQAFLQQAELQIALVGDVADTSAGQIKGLENAWKDLRDSVEVGLSDPISELSGWLTGPIKAMTEYNKAANALDQAVEEGIISSAEGNAILRQVENTSYTAAEAQEWLTQKTREHTEATWDLVRASVALAETEGTNAHARPVFPDDPRKALAIQGAKGQATSRYRYDAARLEAGLAGAVDQQAQGFAEQQQALIERLAELGQRMQEVRAQEIIGPEQYQQLYLLQDQVNATSATFQANAAAHEEATHRILLDMIQQQIGMMELEGAAASTAQSMVLQLAEAWGLVGAGTAQAWDDIHAALSGLATDGAPAAIAAIQAVAAAALAASGIYPITFMVSTVTAASPMDSPTGILPGEIPAAVEANAAAVAAKKKLLGGGGGGGGGGGSGSSSTQKDKLHKRVSMLGGLSSFASVAGRLYQEREIDPLNKRLAEIDARLAIIDELNQAGHIDVGLAQDGLKLAEERTALEKERAEAADKAAKAEERMLEIQKKQDRISFLQAQLDLMDLIKTNGLNAASILNGVKLGYDADMGAILDALGRAMDQMIVQVESQLSATGMKQGKKDGGKKDGGKKASGGVLRADSYYLVGENGPEPFFPSVPGRLLSNHEARAALVGGEQATTTGNQGASTAVNLTVAEKLDIEAVAERVVQIIQRRQRR